MWFERYVIVLTLSRDFLPSSWGMYYPTWVDMCTYIGSLGLFFTFFLLFLRTLPMIAMAEVKAVMPQADPHYMPEAHAGGGRSAPVPAAPHGGNER
jgi:molybdopterin-containing oxidoreductase family membrane subunit